MEMTGSRQIAADRAAVWAALNDPEVLKTAIPGCQELHGSPETGFEATVKQKVGPVSATFHGAVQLSNVVPGTSYHIAGEGKGGAAGFAKGGADVSLEDKDGGTLLSYDVKASVGGKLAQLGSRLIDGFAKKMADQFFENFQKAVEGASATAAAETTAAEAAETIAEPVAEAVAAEAAPVVPAAPVAPAASAEAAAPAPVVAAAPAAQPAAAAAEPPAKKAGWLKRLLGGKA